MAKGLKFSHPSLLGLHVAALGLMLALLAGGCSPTRKLEQGEHLLVKNKVVNDSRIVSKSDLEGFIRQKPNRRILGFYRFHLQVFNLVNEQKMEAAGKRIAAKNEARNIRRVAKGKDPKERRRSFWEWLRDIGEEPVIYDALMAKKSAEQLEFYLRGKGHFNAVVTDSVSLDPKHRKARAYYTVRSGIPYRVRLFKYDITDRNLAGLVKPETGRSSIVRPGMNYDVEKFQKERERIDRLLKSNGFYAFDDSYVRFRADSATGTHEVDMTLYIEGPVRKDTALVKSKGHQTYTIRNIYVHTDHDPKRPFASKDTLFYNGIYFIADGRFKYRPDMLYDKLFFNEGDLYRIRRSELTYQYLSSLRAFRLINVSFQDRIEADGSHVLDCYIQLSPAMQQSYAIEAQGTNTEGNLGVSASITYQNRNLFRGAEILEFKLRGGIETQVVSTNVADRPIWDGLPFNTLEFSPEISLTVPKFLAPFKTDRLLRYGNPRTIMSVAYNFQQRPDYTRSIFTGRFGYQWSQGLNLQHRLNPLEVNFVNIYNEDPQFIARIEGLRDELLRNSYRPHMTTATNYTLIYSGQKLNKRENFSFMRLKLESSGNLLRGIFAAAQADKDTTGSYRMFNIPFSQYLKYEIDFRRYVMINTHSQAVFRAYHGLAYPLLNLGAVPFESSFFAGGANGIRAWRVRSLGPGSLPDSLNLRDQFADIKLEFNIEYRFDIFRWFKGAVFADAGNIWLVKPDKDRPNSNFDFTRFYKEIALGMGVGLRLDFNFFVIRLDVATPFHDPSFEEGNRWVIDRFRFSDVNLNIGIGYPF
ncbi:MAG: outer membrane protein assembly factor [Flavobacteriales bacterium]|nr:outer membrane protein assembly factor [Flavobacteriales bacterium]